jgi:hypothetical protein
MNFEACLEAYLDVTTTSEYCARLRDGRELQVYRSYRISLITYHKSSGGSQNTGSNLAGLRNLSFSSRGAHGADAGAANLRSTGKGTEHVGGAGCVKKGDKDEYSKGASTRGQFVLSFKFDLATRQGPTSQPLASLVRV